MRKAQARVHRVRRRSAEAADQAKVATFQQLVFAFQFPEESTRDIIAVAQKAAAPAAGPAEGEGWYFIMLGVREFDAACDRIEAECSRAALGLRLLRKCLLYLAHDTRVVRRSRLELARDCGCREQEVSTIMGELAELGIVKVDRKGRSREYRLDPNVATHLAEEVRPAFQRDWAKGRAA